MAELVLSAVSLGLALPGIVIIFAECGDYIVRKIQNFRHASEVLNQLRTFGFELHQRKLKADIEIADEAFRSGEYDDTLKESLNDYIKALALQLVEARKYVDEVCVDSIIRGFLFTTFREKKGRRLNTALKEWQSGFIGTVQLLQTHKQFVSTRLLLDENILKDIGDAVNLDAEAQPQGPNTNAALLIGNCEYKAKDPNGRSEHIENIVVLFERVTGPSVSEEQVRSIAMHLTRHFKQSEHRGILPCLGYRFRPFPELCFQIPSAQIQILSLASIINRDSATSGIFQRILEDRFALAKAVSQAVLSIGATNFVHKSIRSGTIMLLQPQSGQPSTNMTLGKPFLTTWQYLRMTTNLSNRSNPIEDWQEDVYRHPARHGVQAQDRYNIGHDIYSLGVCLLEIGLWSTLSIPDTNNEAMPAPYFVKAAARYYNVPVQGFDLLLKFHYPQQIQEILVGIVEADLPARMGSAYSQLVKQCLTCLEGGFGQDINFQDMKSVEAGVFFNDVVLASFPGLVST